MLGGPHPSSLLIHYKRAIGLPPNAEKVDVLIRPAEPLQTLHRLTVGPAGSRCRDNALDVDSMEHLRGTWSV